jgi:hypothetical protein
MKTQFKLYKNNSTTQTISSLPNISNYSKSTLTLLDNSYVNVQNQETSSIATSKFTIIAATLGMFLGFAVKFTVSHSLVDSFFTALGISLVGAMFGILIDEARNK